jgi:hypothetical protein
MYMIIFEIVIIKNFRLEILAHVFSRAVSMGELSEIRNDISMVETVQGTNYK